jgi:hypothetical protein
MHNHTRGLKDLAERLETAIDRIANDGTISLEQLEFFEWKLSLALAALDRRLKEDRWQAAAIRELGPQTLFDF